MGLIETSIVNHYAAVRKRIAYPPKRPIVVTKTNTTEAIGKPRQGGGGRPPSYCRARLLHLYLQGLSTTAIAEELGVTARAIRKVIRLQGRKR